MGFIMNYQQLTGLFFLCLFIACCAAGLALYIKDKYKNRALPTSLIRQPSQSMRDQIYAWNVIGDDSVYQFLLGKSFLGWAIALVTMGLQIWMLFVFVKVSRHLYHFLSRSFLSNSCSNLNLIQKGRRKRLIWWQCWFGLHVEMPPRQCQMWWQRWFEWAGVGGICSFDGSSPANGPHQGVKNDCAVFQTKAWSPYQDKVFLRGVAFDYCDVIYAVCFNNLQRGYCDE